MQEDIIKDSKNFKQSKCQNIKKNTDALIIVQKDLQNCVKDFHKIRSEYKNEGDEKTNNKIFPLFVFEPSSTPKNPKVNKKKNPKDQQSQTTLDKRSYGSKPSGINSIGNPIK